MPRLIDANKLKTKAIADPDSGEGLVYVQDIDEAPTVDAVEVVRCKDCKYGELVDDGFSLYLCHHHGSDWNEGEHFCSNGERKDNG